ncbi:MAG: acetate--CoA ligase family protein [Candidatus Thermoplasmatota archaeon]|nr:acetate--CoA ligase family protein [Candidatus Thermoplasmatota archaeon]
MTDLERFFEPRNVAVIGASSNPGKIGYKTFNNLVKGGYRGGMFPVNLAGEDVCGQKGYGSLEEIEAEIDLALICIPARFVKDSLEECGKKGIPFVVIITSGFREIGNVEGERELMEVARRYNIRILGPNVFGMIYTPSNLNAQFGNEKVLPGNVAIITQSGSLGIALMDRVFQEGIGVSAMTSVGNKADLSDEEILDFLVTDENTRIILMYIEGLKDGREFIRRVKEVSRVKPVIILKSGRSKAGAKAVASHTASLAGADSLFDAAFKQAGAIRAPTLREAIDWTRALNDLPLPVADDILVITNGGGFGILAIDEIGLSGLPLFYNLEWIIQKIGPLVPPFASLSNPVDITAQTPPEGYIKCLETAMAEETIGSVIGIYGATAGIDVDRFTGDLISSMKDPKKPLVLCYIGGKDADRQIRAFNEAGLPAFYFPEEAVSSLEVLYRYRKYRNSRDRELPPLIKWDLGRIGKLIERTRKNKHHFMDLETSLEFLKAGPIELCNYRVVRNIDSAVKAAREIGFPVVMKGSASDLIHKTERGGVITDIDSIEELVEAFEKLEPISEKIIVMEQISGREVIVSSIRDGVFGPSVMFGVGGVMVEAMNDVTFRVAPIGELDAEEMMDEIRGKALLGAFRGKKEADRKKIAQALKALGDLLIQVPEITDIEINPLFISDKGAVAVDCRVRIG